MKKICLVIVGLYLMLLQAFAQVTKKDVAAYEARPLKVEEVNLVSSYYSQNGDYSAITGDKKQVGIAKGYDIANGIELKLSGVNRNAHKNSLTLGAGIAHHSFASQSYTNLAGTASPTGNRVYPSINWENENLAKGTSINVGASYSHEYNYKSFGINGGFAKKTNNNGEFSLKAGAYFDKVKMIYPDELWPTTTYVVPSGTKITTVTTASGRKVTTTVPSGTYTTVTQAVNDPDKSRNTFNVALSFAQVINERMQGSITVEPAAQSGYLGLPFHRVYFSNGKDTIEKLPSERLKLPIGLRLNYFAGDNIIIRSYYRLYTDDWGIASHTANIEVPVKITPFFSISPFYRYYTQTASKYYAPYKSHPSTDAYYTSNYSLGAFDSHFYGAGLRISSPGLLFKTLELRYGHYTQTVSNLKSNVISVNLSF